MVRTRGGHHPDGGGPAAGSLSGQAIGVLLGVMLALAGCTLQTEGPFAPGPISTGTSPIDGAFFPIQAQLTTNDQTVSIGLSTTFSGDLSAAYPGLGTAFTEPLLISVDGGPEQSLPMSYAPDAVPDIVIPGQPDWPGSPGYAPFSAFSTYSATLPAGVHTFTFSHPAIQGFNGCFSPPSTVSVDVEPGQPSTSGGGGAFDWTGVTQAAAGGSTTLSLGAVFYPDPPDSNTVEGPAEPFAIPCAVMVDGVLAGTIAMGFSLDGGDFEGSGTAVLPTPGAGIHAIGIVTTAQVNATGIPLSPFSFGLEASPAAGVAGEPLQGVFLQPTILPGPVSNNVGGIGMPIAVYNGGYVGTVGGDPQLPPTVDLDLVGVRAGRQVSTITVPYAWSGAEASWTNSLQTGYSGFTVGSCQGLEPGLQTITFAPALIPGYTGILPAASQFIIEVSSPPMPDGNG